MAAAPHQNDDASNYSRQAQYRFMNRAGPFSTESIPRSMTQNIRAILDTGSSGNDFPTWIIKELGCEEIDNPLAHIPINTVLGQYYCQVQHERKLKLHYTGLRRHTEQPDDTNAHRVESIGFSL